MQSELPLFAAARIAALTRSLASVATADEDKRTKLARVIVVAAYEQGAHDAVELVMDVKDELHRRSIHDDAFVGKPARVGNATKRRRRK